MEIDITFLNLPFSYIKNTYKVPAEIGREVMLDGKKGIIVQDLGNYIGVNFEGDKPTAVHACHPTWHVEYLGIGKLPKVTASQKRYREFLEADSGLSFAEYIGIKKTHFKNL